MELRHLRYFVAVAEELNFRRAAARLNIAAPPLSVQINRLEEEIGADLFVREGRGVKLTPAGHVFLDHARKTLGDAARGVAAARQAANGEIGELSIGHNMPAGFRVFPNTVPAFKQAWPQVRLTFHHLTIGEQLEGLRREKLDVGVVWLPIQGDEFDVHELLVEPLVAVLPSDHPLADAPEISVRDLARDPLVLLSRASDPDSYREIEHMFAQARAPMQVAYQLENSVAMINFVAMRCGVSLLPSYAQSIRQDGVVFKNLAAPGLTKTLAIIKKKGAGALAETFFRFTANQLSQAAPANGAKRRRRGAR